MKDEKPKWAQPRNFQFEIAPDLKISVQHWVRNRQVTLSHIFESYKPKSARTTPDRWITSSGVIVNQNDIGNAYEYGDKLVLIEGNIQRHSHSLCKGWEFIWYTNSYA